MSLREIREECERQEAEARRAKRWTGTGSLAVEAAPRISMAREIAAHAWIGGIGIAAIFAFGIFCGLVELATRHPRTSGLDWEARTPCGFCADPGCSVPCSGCCNHECLCKIGEKR